MGHQAGIVGPVGRLDRLPAERDRTRPVPAAEARLGGRVEQVDPVDRWRARHPPEHVFPGAFEDLERPRVEPIRLRVGACGHCCVAGTHRSRERTREVMRLEQVMGDLGGRPGPRPDREVRSTGKDPGQRGMEPHALTRQEVVRHGLADQGMTEGEPAVGLLHHQDRPVDGLAERVVEIRPATPARTPRRAPRWPASRLPPRCRAPCAKTPTASRAGPGGGLAASPAAEPSAPRPRRGAPRRGTGCRRTGRRSPRRAGRGRRPGWPAPAGPPVRRRGGRRSTRVVRPLRASSASTGTSGWRRWSSSVRNVATIAVRPCRRRLAR